MNFLQIDGAVVNLLEMDITVSILKKIKNTGFDMSRVAVFCMNKEQKKLIESEVCRLGDEFKVDFNYDVVAFELF